MELCTASIAAAMTAACLCCAPFAGMAAEADLICVTGSVIEAEAVVSQSELPMAHPLASAGRVVELRPGQSLKATPGVAGVGLLFLNAICTGAQANIEVNRAGDTNRFVLAVRKGAPWSSGQRVALEDNTVLVLSAPAESPGPIWLDRLFFTTDLTAHVFGSELRNDLTAWGNTLPAVRSVTNENLVVNGDFETPFGGEWFLAWFAPFFLCNHDRLEDGAGGRFLRLELDRYANNARSIGLVSALIETRPGVDYLFQCRLRGAGDEVAVHLQGDLPTPHEVKDAKGLADMAPRRRVTLTSDWQQVSIPFQGGGRCVIQFACLAQAPGSGAHLDVDDVSIREATLTSVPVAPLAAGLALPDPAPIFTEGAPLACRLDCRFGVGHEAEIMLKSFDVFGEQTAMKSVRVSGQAGCTVSMDFSLDWIDPRPCGAYRVELWSGEHFLKEHSFCVLPAPVAAAASSRFLGVYSAASKELIPVIKRLGITSVGSQNLALELSMLDRIMPGAKATVIGNPKYAALLYDAGLEVVATHLGRPKWLSRDNPTQDQLDLFSARVREWADLHEGAIDAVLAWMELRQKDATEGFSRLLAAECAGLAAAGKPPRVFLGAGPPEQAERLMVSGGAAVAGVAASLRYAGDADLAAYARLCGERRLRLWDMEESTWHQPFYRRHLNHNSFHKTDKQVLSPAYACAALVRSAVRGRALAGMERMLYYYMGPASTWFGWLHYNSLTLTDFDNTIHPVGVSLAYLTSRLDGATGACRLETPDGIEAYGFENTNGATIAAWCDAVVAASLTAPGSEACVVRDVTGRPLPCPSIALSRVPVFITSPKMDLDHLVAVFIRTLGKSATGVVSYAVAPGGALTVGIRGIAPARARPFDMEAAWMESAWENPLSREWRTYASGHVPVADVAASGVRMPAAEMADLGGAFWQFPLTVLVAHPDERVHVGRFDAICMNAVLNPTSVRRGKPSEMDDLGAVVTARYNRDTLFLCFDILDDVVRAAPGAVERGDALIVRLGTGQPPFEVRPPPLAGPEPGASVPVSVPLVRGIAATLSRTRWGWRVEVRAPLAALLNGGAAAQANVQFAFECRDADDSDIQQRVLQWGMRASGAGPDAGVILLAP